MISYKLKPLKNLVEDYQFVAKMLAYMDNKVKVDIFGEIHQCEKEHCSHVPEMEPQFPLSR